VNLTELLVGLAVLVGVVGVLVPVLPGSVLILVAVLVWAVQDCSSTAWTVFSVVVVLLALGAVVKYAVPGRNLKAAGVPNRTLLLGGLLGLVGFFVAKLVYPPMLVDADSLQVLFPRLSFLVTGYGEPVN